MDLRHMRHFVAVAEELHFGRAASRLNMAQPPLSQSIKRLEDDLGARLFDRTARGAILTDVGKAYLVEARRTLMQADLARKVALRVAAQAQDLRISFSGASLYRLLPELIVRFRTEEPQYKVRLLERESQDQVKALLMGDVDIGIVVAAAEGIETFERMTVMSKRYVAAIPSDWPLARKSSITLEELGEQPFIQPPQEYLRQFGDRIISFQRSSIVPHVIQEATQNHTAMSLVAAGLGCTIASSAALFPRDDITFLPIPDHPPELRFELLMIWRPQPTANAAAFIAMTSDYLRGNSELIDPVDPPHPKDGAPARASRHDQPPKREP